MAVQVPCAMRLGAFLMPAHPPGRPLADCHADDLATLVRLDALGFEEAWVGEHYTAAWEPCPAPDLLIAQALAVTSRMRLGPLGHLLPYHHPVTLAHRAAYLDQIGGGRYQLGVGISALPSDRELFAVPPTANRRMTYESLGVMASVWSGTNETIQGEFWRKGRVETGTAGLGLHMRPLNGRQPPIAIAAMTPGSENHRLAGEHGWLPVSLGVDADCSITARHWDAVAEGAARTGRVADRAAWRVVRDVVVADTDAAALALARDSMMGRCWREFLIPLYRGLGLQPFLFAGSSLADDATDDAVFEHVCARLWVCGAPATVAARLGALRKALGGFGVLLVPCYDETGTDGWQASHALLAGTVLPMLGEVAS